MQIVVSKHRDASVIQTVQIAQGFERLGPAVNHVAHRPEHVSGRVEIDFGQQAFEWLEAALNVANSVNRHTGIYLLDSV